MRVSADRSARNQDEPFRVLIAGGGVAALEGLLAVTALAGERVAVTLLAPDHEFHHRPLSVTEPFGLAAPRTLSLAEVAEAAGATYVAGALSALDPAARRAGTADGGSLEYDAALIAIGARGSDAVPGALTFRDARDASAFGEVLGELEQGAVRRLVFAVPVGRSWPLGLYELALLSASHLRRRGVTGAELTLVTPESHPLEVFGPRPSDAVAELLDQAGVELRAKTVPIAFEGGELAIRDGSPIACDRVISVADPVVTQIEGIPRDPEGFIPVDPYGGVLGLERVFAAGDATSTPVKQGGLGAQLADCAASSIAALAGAPVEPQEFRPVLRAALLTETGPWYMRTPLDEPGAALAAPSILWWPPAKLAGTHLGPYLARGELVRGPQGSLEDLEPPPVTAPASAGAAHEDVVAAALASADDHARLEDYRGALHWLEVAEELQLYLPAEYEDKRASWRQLSR